VRYWVPADGHPRGSSTEPWFSFEGTEGWRATGHPQGASEDVCLRIVENWVWPVASLPGEGPRFEIIGSFVYLAGAAGPPWFEVRGVDESHDSI
jgi:hypothetical protein